MDDSEKSPTVKQEQQIAEEKLRLVETQKKIAEAEQAIAEAQKAKQAALLPTGSSKPVEGTITTDEKVGYIADLTAYDAMMRIAAKVAEEIDHRLSIEKSIVEETPLNEIVTLQIKEQVKQEIDKAITSLVIHEAKRKEIVNAIVPDQDGKTLNQQIASAIVIATNDRQQIDERLKAVVSDNAKRKSIVDAISSALQSYKSLDQPMDDTVDVFVNGKWFEKWVNQAGSRIQADQATKERIIDVFIEEIHKQNFITRIVKWVFKKPLNQKLRESIALRLNTETFPQLIGAIKTQFTTQPYKANLLIVDSLDFFFADVQLRQISTQLKSWATDIQNQKTEITKLIQKQSGQAAAPSGIASPFAMVAGILSATADIIGYFKIDYDIKGRSISLSNLALQSCVAGKIQNHNVHLLHFHRIGESSSLLTAFHTCLANRHDLIIEMAALKTRITVLQTEITTTKNEIQTRQTNLAKLTAPKGSSEIETLKKEISNFQTTLQKTETHKSEVDVLYTRAEALVKGFDEFNKLITDVPEGKIHSLLTAAAIQNHLDTQQITHILYLTIPSSGGEIIKGNSLFQSGQVRFLGGCVVSYVLADTTGKILASDTLADLSTTRFQLNQDTFQISSAWQKR